MARFVNENKLEDVRKLITHTTKFSRDQENFRRCESFALSMLYNHTYLDPHKSDVNRAVYGIIEKLTIHAHFQRAKHLKEAYEKLLANEDISHEYLSSILHFLMNMASNPSADKPVKINRYLPNDSVKQPDTFDWGAYLMEGVEIDPEIGQESSDESIWSLGDDEKSDEEKEFCRSEDIDSLAELTDELEIADDESQTTETVEQEDILASINDGWRANENGYRSTMLLPSSQCPAAKLIDMWVDVSSKMQEAVPSIRVLSEYMIVRELLWALRDPEASGLVFHHVGNGQFCVATDLTQALQTALSKFCPILTMLYEMQKFVSELIPSIDTDNCTPPSTYKAYACGLHVIFTKQNSFLLELEKRVMKQDKIATVQSIGDDLYDWIQFQTAIFSVHRKAVDDWKTQDSWICASKLLSVLGSAVDEAQSLQMAAVLLSLLFSSLNPYLTILETWIKSGTLQDTYLEFLIYEDIPVQDESISTSQRLLEGSYESRRYEEALRSRSVAPLPLLRPLVNQGEIAGRSIQLLQGLKVMESIPHPDNKESLASELLNMVRKKLLPTIGGIEEEDLGFQDTEPLETGSEYEKPTLLALDEYTREYMLTSDTYILKVFGDVLDLGLDVSHQQENFTLPKGQLLFKTGEVGMLQPLAPILCRSLGQLLVARVEVLGQKAQQLLHERCRLGTHLAALRGVALLEAGVVMHQFFTYITTKVLLQEDWRKYTSWYLLTNQLQACLSQHKLEWSHLFSIAISDKRDITTTSEITEGFPLMQFLNHLDLQYNMEWPITLVLREENMLMYNRVFRFLAKIKCALITLQRLRLQDMQNAYSEEILPRRLAVLRSWLLFLLGSLQEHLLGHILTTLRAQLDSALAEAKDLQSALGAHELFVKKSHAYCLLEPKTISIHNMIMEVVALAMSVADNWCRGDMTAQQVTDLETDYSKLHSFLTYLFTNLTRFGANLHWAGVAAALLDSTPPY